MNTTSDDPYKGNVLIDYLPPIPSPKSALRSLLYKPRLPSNMAAIPTHIRLHYLAQVCDLHVPTEIERQLLQTIDLMVRQSYSYRDPLKPSTWASVSGEAERAGIRLQQAKAAAVEGIAGVGKTQACLRGLHALGPQTIRHESFPKLVGGLTQVVWISVEVPASGKSADLARELMSAWDAATGHSRFSSILSKVTIPNGMGALEEWRQVAVSSFLGVLHLDEVQNLFKIASLKQRASRSGPSARPELSIVEDQVLRWILHLTNTGQVPLLASGTPDGIGALTRRLSTMQRLQTAGYHRFDPFTDPESPRFRKHFLETLGEYQYVQHRLPVDSTLSQVLIELTAGIPRVIIALWVAAHRVAFERKDDDLKISDFTEAARTWLAPLAPAISAIQRGDAAEMSKYEDLVSRDTSFWANFWSNALGPMNIQDPARKEKGKPK